MHVEHSESQKPALGLVSYRPLAFELRRLYTVKLGLTLELIASDAKLPEWRSGGRQTGSALRLQSLSLTLPSRQGQPLPVRLII